MKKFIPVILVLFSINFFFVSCNSDDNNTPPQQQNLQAETFLNVSYGNDPQQIYDLYLPANRTSTKTKVIVLVHGGGWTEGDKADMNGYVTQIKASHPDHAIVNMNYVLATASIPAFPNQYLDLGRVIEKITNEKETLQLLPEFGLIGVSAGAHISLMYDYTFDFNNRVKFVCDIVGPTDFTDAFYSNNPNFNILLELLVDESYYPPGTNYAIANSPALLVSSDSSRTILFYGNQDPLVPLSTGQLLKDELSSAMVTHSFTIYNGGHGNWSIPDIINLQAQISSFISTHLSI